VLVGQLDVHVGPQLFRGLDRSGRVPVRGREDEMSRSEGEWAVWAREHRACFQNAPLIEVVKAERVQVGFSLTLYVAAPLEAAPGPERTQAITKLWDELKELADDIAPPEERSARVQPEQAARVVLRPENEFKPEVGLTFHVFPRQAALAGVSNADRERMAQVERRLLAHGIKQGRA
jgi:hypothetical protein